jgi:hypothetical protein
MVALAIPPENTFCVPPEFTLAADATAAEFTV